MKKTFIILMLLFAFFHAFAQKEKIIQCGNQTHYARALKIHKKSLYVGFSDGELYAIHLKSNVPKKLIAPNSLTEIRDLAVLKNELYVLESSDTSELWKMDLKSQTWSPIRLVHDAVFLDDIVSTKHEIYCFGDAINDSLVIYSVRGDSTIFKSKWIHFLPTGNLAIYAASGSAAHQHSYFEISLIYQNNGSYYSQFIIHKHFKRSKPLPLLKSESGGAFSMVLYEHKKNRNIAIVGGDYLHPNRNDSIACYSIDNGKTFLLSETQPKGYRSHVIQLKENKLVAVGPTGIDVSSDGGKNWRYVQEGSFHACIKKGKYVYYTGNNGKVYRLKWKYWFKPQFAP
jgi:hypothetical protein